MHSTQSVAASSASERTTAVTATDLHGEFAALQRTYGTDLAVAWAPVGRPSAVQVLGSTTDVDAWSTMKVPIALATEQDADGSPTASQKALLRQTIVSSDNASALSLWNGLGDPSTRIDTLLRANGDLRTKTARGHDGDSAAFGMTAWEVADQARFAAMLPCADDAAAVLELMSRIDPSQQWGLGVVDGARFKGGWGPSDNGYLVRQLGVIPVGGRLVAVTAATQPPDGSHESGTAALGEVARWLEGHLSTANAGACPA